jgi:indole-3-glycerol phosphate synthase
MKSILKDIIERKKVEVESKKKQIAALEKRVQLRSSTPKLSDAIRQQPLSVIAEIKRRSPSCGHLAFLDPCMQARIYQQAGAAAISILTDFSYFGGTVNDLQTIARTPEFEKMPLLMKEFIIDPIQVYEAALLGASAVLLIVAVLGKETREMIKEAHNRGLEALVEVHNEDELAVALDAKAEILGVNNRNLTTFEVNLGVAEKLAPLLPKSLIRVAESGIKSLKDAQRIKASGYNALLVGEALVTATDPGSLIRSFIGKP